MKDVGVDLAIRKLQQIKAMIDLFSHWGEEPQGKKLVSLPAKSLVDFCGAIEDMAAEAVEALVEVPARKLKTA